MCTVFKMKEKHKEGGGGYISREGGGDGGGLGGGGYIYLKCSWSYQIFLGGDDVALSTTIYSPTRNRILSIE